MPTRIPRLLATAVALLAITSPVAGAKSKALAPANSGTPGSRCAAAGVSAPRPDDAASLDTTSLGAAPAPYAIGAPTNKADKGQPAKRVMMLLHGGGWYIVGQGALDAMQGGADLWRDVGWESVNVDYQPCKRSITSALAMYDLVRAHYAPSVPICISGDSAGAHLALIIASKRPGVSCVIANAPPTDLVKVARQGVHAAFAGVAPQLLAKGAVATSAVAQAAFGKRGLRTASPVQRAATIHTRVLLAIAKDDLLIPVAQIATMRRLLAKANPGGYIVADVLDPGSQTFVHGTASPAEVEEYYHQVAALVEPFGSAPDAVEQSTAKPVKGIAGLIDNVLDKLLGGIFKKRG